MEPEGVRHCRRKAVQVERPDDNAIINVNDGLRPSSKLPQSFWGNAAHFNHRARDNQGGSGHGVAVDPDAQGHLSISVKVPRFV